MPTAHRDFILYIKKNINFLEYIKHIKSDDINEAYDAILKSLKKFREIHWGLAFRYIIKMVYKEMKADGSTISLKELEDTIIGSGGTYLKKFLREAIQDTNNSMINKARDFKNILYKNNIGKKTKPKLN